MTHYSEDLAFIHDRGFGDFARAAAPFLLAELRRGGFTTGRVVDLGCGSGIWARSLVDAGYAVHGLDISPAMIELARARVPEGRFDVGSFTSFDPPSSVAVTALGEPLAYLFDGANTTRALHELCRRVFRALEPSGLFVFDLREPGTAPEGSYEISREGDGWKIDCRVEEDRRRRRLSRRIVATREVGSGERRTEEVHHLRLYWGAEVASELRRIGFKVRIRRSLGELELGTGHVALLARRPG